MPLERDEAVEHESRPAAQPAAAGPELPARPPAMPAGMSNAAIARAAAAGLGTALPSNAHGALRALGAQASEVRLHTGAAADAKLAARPDALAATEGTDIFLGRSAPALDSPGGELLLAHEAAHVRQQTAAGPAVSREVAEAQADQAAVAAQAGVPIPALSAASGPLYFEAKWHQASLTGAMKSLGFTDAEQQAAYFGNWCRDLSQALVPMAASTIGTQAAFQLVNLLAMHKFGHGVTPAQLGAYDPRQHIDNPAGTTDRDVLPSGVEIKGYGPDGHAAGPEDAAALAPDRIKDSFAVSAAGVPAYMESSRQVAEREALAAISAGRTPEGMMHVGTFSHIIEDLFAHSNWIEIAVGDVVAKKPSLIPAGETRNEVQERLKENRPPIENYAADVAKDGKGARPILSTGTFSGGGSGNDTLVSVKAELQNILRDREPFKEDGGGGEMYDFAIEVLRRAEASADEGSLGDIFTTVVEQAASGLGGMALGKLNALPGEARKTFGDGVLGDVASGAAELLGEGAEAVSGVAGDAWKAGLKEAVKTASNHLGGAISLAEIAVYLKGGVNEISQAWKALKDGVRELPEAIREIFLPELVAAERSFKKQLRTIANAAYGRAVEVLIDQVEGLHPAADTAETNVGVKEEDIKKRLAETKQKMIDALKEVGGSEGADVANEIKNMNDEQIAAFASSDAFHRILAALADDISARARLQGIAEDMGDKQHTLSQLANVPPWAKAGASHSQIAKDHDDGAFFGVAFACAQKADHILMSELQAAWMDAGFIGPGAGMENNIAVDEKGNVVPTGNEAQDARNKKFLETRADGDYTIEHGAGPNKDVGPRLVELGKIVDKLITERPILGPILSGLSWALSHDADVEAAKAELERTREQWETAARSGTYDDAVMDAVDKAVGTVARALTVMGTDRDGHDHPFDSHHPKQQHDNPKTKDEDEGHEHGGRDEVAYQSQLKKLQENRGKGAVEATEGVGKDRKEQAAAPIVEKIREIFNHPYETSWWRGDVEKWCEQHGPVLERSIKDRNAGVMHSHQH